MKRIVIIALALVACNNSPHVVNPDNGVWVKCESGNYCYRNNEVCGARGHACSETECCSWQDSGRVFGLKKRAQSTAPEGR